MAGIHDLDHLKASELPANMMFFLPPKLCQQESNVNEEFQLTVDDGDNTVFAIVIT
jgi:hypothetical protein